MDNVSQERQAVEAKKIKTAGGTFDPDEGSIYFIASNVDSLDFGGRYHKHLLIAVNEFGSLANRCMTSWIEQGKKIFIDSGIFFLTNVHKRKYEISMDEALALPPEQIDGFEKLYNAYIQITRMYEKECWGYIELDQGGRENKIRTRTGLEALGLRPIPVYHPFNDGWDYFDYLCERYDRICFGNVVQADRYTRKRLIATAWERHRKYPETWIHLLGYTPNELLYAMPINSGDSSSWLSSTRWSGYKPKAAGVSMGQMPRHFQYVLGQSDGERGRIKALGVAAYGVNLSQRNWRNHLDEMKGIGFDLYPAKRENEK